MLYLLNLLIFFLAAPAFSTDPITEIIVEPHSIGTNETAEIRVRVFDDKPREAPQLSASSDKFRIDYRGSATQRQVNIVNGRIEQKTVYSYTYSFIPSEAGNFTIPAFIVTTSRGNRIYTEPSKITVQNIAAARPQRMNRANPFSAFFAEPIDAFLMFKSKNDRIIQNTGEIIDLYIYSNDPNFINNPPDLRMFNRAQFEGGLIREIVIDQKPEITTEQFGYRTYYRRLIGRYLIIPLDTGNLSLRPPGYRAGNMNILGDAVSVNSYPVTERLSYIGNEVNISHELSADSAEVSDEIKLTLVIEGDGNVDFFADPYKNLNLSNVFISEPSTSIEIQAETEEFNDFRIKKTFNYTLVPREAGSVDLPPLNLSFALPDGTPTNAVHPALSFDVAPAPARANTDMPYIENPRSRIIYGSGLILYIIAVFLGSILMIASSAYQRKRDKLDTDSVYARAAGAKKRRRAIFSTAEKAISEGRYKDAAGLIRQGILYYCADKFNISNSASPKEIADTLTQRGFTMQKGFITLMSDLDFHTFGTPPTELQTKEYLSEAYNTLNHLDKLPKQTSA